MDNAPQFTLDSRTMIVTVWYEDGSTYKRLITDEYIQHLLYIYGVEFGE